MSLIEEFFNGIAPYECVGCRKEGSLICYECADKLVRIPPRCYRCGRWTDNFRTCAACRRQSPIHSLWAATRYEGVAKDVLHQVKFERAKSGIPRVAELMPLPTWNTNDTVLVYIPTANSRVRQRGYDQAAVLARTLSRRLGLPLARCLARVTDKRQVGQGRAARQQQMSSAFRPLAVETIKNKHVVLVDDVLTTGATCEAAARVLKQAGAKRVSALVFAVA
jgi:ComF family protein